LARRLPDAFLHAEADPRGTDARPENAERRRDAACRCAPELLRRSVDPRGPVRRPSRVGRRPCRGPAALRGPRLPGLSHPRIVGRLLRAPIDRGRPEAQAGLDVRVAQGAATLEGGRPLPRLRPVRHGRAPPDGLPRDAPAGRVLREARECGARCSMKFRTAPLTLFVFLLVPGACVRKPVTAAAKTPAAPAPLPYEARLGKITFTHYCETCHGESGAGNGVPGRNLGTP